MRREFVAVHFLVGIGVGVPERAVARDVVAAHASDATPGPELRRRMRVADARWLRSRPVQRNVCVVGVGLADGPVRPDLTGMMLEAQAFRRALDDAGLEKCDIDGLASAGYGGMHEVQLAEYLGLTPRWLESTRVGGSSFEFHAMHAYRAIQNGDVDTVAIVYGNNQLVGVRAARWEPAAAVARRWRHGDAAADGVRVPDRAHARRLVRDGRATAHARVRHDARTTRVDRGADARARGRNPDAMYRDPITVDDVLGSKLVADPLHKLDCCVISDGGCCIILTTEERARDLAHRPVYVRGAAGGTTHHSIQPWPT